MDEILHFANKLTKQAEFPIVAPISNRIAYVVGHSQSYFNNAYAARTQGVAQGLIQRGFEPICFIPPAGLEKLSINSEKIVQEEEFQGVRYIHAQWPDLQISKSGSELFEAQVESLVELFCIYRPRLVLAASNYDVALPALIAARRLELPFHYEVRDFNEMSSIEQQDREIWTCAQADQVYALSQLTQTELEHRGIPFVQHAALEQQIVDPVVQVIKGEELKVEGLRVACIMDNFTYSSYSPEANFFQLSPEHWQEELEEFKPELLFIESAWRGKEELWGNKVGRKSQELQGIVAWCNEHDVPTVFWNKEDPVHFETFLNTALLFDFVFTTDLDCIHRYKAALGHENVYFLPFACQPALTNPIETYRRKDAFCFAGAYYVRYPDRTRDLESYIEELPKFRPLEIYDRNYGQDDPNYQFPESYHPYIVGTLPFNEIDKAYKGYRYAINLNSVKQSQTMFARRVYELLGCNTITVSNFSRGVRLMFGDLVLTSDSGAEIVRRLQELESKPAYADKFRLAGLRKILSEHTYQARFDYVLSKVTGEDRSSQLPKYTVISLVESKQQLQHTIDNVLRQNHRPTHLVIVRAGLVTERNIEYYLNKISADIGVEQVSLDDLENVPLRTLVKKGSWLAAFSTNDYYGPNYLFDMALATRFTDALIIGKGAYYQWCSEGVKQEYGNRAYKAQVDLWARASVVAPSMQLGQAATWVKSIDTLTYSTLKQQAIDAYNYCKNGLNGLAESDEVLKTIQKVVDDVELDVGVPLAELEHLAESTAPASTGAEQIPSFSPEDLTQIFVDLKGAHSKMELTEEGLKVTSKLGEAKHEYLYAKEGNNLTLEQLGKGAIQDGKLPVHIEMTPGLNLSFVLLFFDEKGKRLHHYIIYPNKNNLLDIPEGTATVRLGFRVYQAGECVVGRLLVGEKDLSPENVMGRSDVLLLTNHYPSYDDLYRNGFVHSRVKAYKERGVEVDIFRFRKDQAISWHEFQDVDVITGSPAALRCMLESGRYRHVLVHFLDADMWEVLGDFINDIQVIVWVHGAEVQPWWRREYNYTNEKDLELAKIQSSKRLSFWQDLLNPMPERLSLIFVSQYFADEVMEDVGFRLPDDQYKIIHNPVDTDIFSYVEKDPEQRKKILSIRPYASRKYANDLSVKAVLELSKEPFFDELEFRFIGDGALFDETLLPLRDFSNVIIDRGFLAQPDIAELHKEYGVFLCPTRMDAQGVSKDEAMSSGLVVVTNGVTAIPEFIDEQCGVIAGSEDYLGMAAGIKRLYETPSDFTRLSDSAGKRARKQVAKEKIVKEELTIFTVLSQ